MESSFTIWYTSDRKRPSGLPGRAIRLPIYSQRSNCALALLSTKALMDLANSTALHWKPEWFLHPNTSVQDNFGDITPSMLLALRGLEWLSEICIYAGSAAEQMLVSK